MRNQWLDAIDTIEIRQVYPESSDWTAGKWYIAKFNQAAINFYMNTHEWTGCQMANDDYPPSNYLHKDGEWRGVTMHNNEWTGYYDTKEEAEETLKRFSPQQHL